MTRLPLDDREVKGVEHPAYELSPICCTPGCTSYATEGHHLWRRSFLIGAYDWVRLPDGLIVGNKVGLCNVHHHAITVNAAWITWDEGALAFDWTDLINGARPLQWQPPRHGHVRPEIADEEIAGQEQSTNGHDHLGAVCPTCLRSLPKKKDEPQEEKRPRRTWSITVPKDNREDGAETLDVLLEAAREEMARAGLPYGESDSVRFFVLTAALGLFVQHAGEVLV